MSIGIATKFLDYIPDTPGPLPALTTVQLSQAELARLAFNTLLTEVLRETPATTGTEYVLTTHLVLRESTHLVSENTKGSGSRRS